MLRVPVPVKCGCVIAGTPCGFHAVPVQQNQPSLSWSKTQSGLLHSFANSAPHPVPPRTVPSS
jgi:hypothetical protein